MVSVVVIFVIVLLAIWLIGRLGGASQRKEMFDVCKYKLMFFTMEGCPHCVSFAPEWRKAKSTISEKVCMEEISSDDQELVQKYKVNGYPTVILEDTVAGVQYPYEGERTTKGVVSFVKKYVAT